MAEKKKSQVKYTPPRDETIPEELKKEEPLSNTAEALEDIESTLPKGAKKSSGSEKSLSKIQDDLDSGKITSKQAHRRAGIKDVATGNKGKEDETPKPKPKADIVVKDVVVKGKIVSKKEKEMKAKEKKRFTKITLEDGHTYNSDEKDVACSNCLLPKNKTTTQCFKQPLSPVGLRKFNEGLIDYKGGVVIALPQNDEKG